MRVLIATAELAPFVKVGGLGEAVAGLVRALRGRHIDVTVALPDYGSLLLAETSRRELAVPIWAGPAHARQGEVDGFGQLTLINVPLMARPHPYQDDEGRDWPDNDHRFLAFSAAVASLAEVDPPDLLHLNDWHTAAIPGFLTRPLPCVLTIHNLAYQGVSSGHWLARLPRRSDAYEWYGNMNPLSGAIALANRIVTVSPTYATEILTPELGCGLDGPLRARSDRLKGILNGLDTEAWNPATDPLLPHHFTSDRMAPRGRVRRGVQELLGWESDGRPLIGMVTRLDGQKGVDLALDAFPPDDASRMVLLGTGERSLGQQARKLAASLPDRFSFVEAYDEPLAHRIFGGSDLYLMPSRFEPCGLAHMQAMRYGAIPVVTDVGGLHDTVVDADQDRGQGTGFVASHPTSREVNDALRRGLAGWRSTVRRGSLRRRAMERDWSWSGPASEYESLYRTVVSEAR